LASYEASGPLVARFILDIAPGVWVVDVDPVDVHDLTGRHVIGVELVLRGHAERLQGSGEGRRQIVGYEAIKAARPRVLGQVADERVGIDEGRLVVETTVAGLEIRGLHAAGGRVAQEYIAVT